MDLVDVNQAVYTGKDSGPMNSGPRVFFPFNDCFFETQVQG